MHLTRGGYQRLAAIAAMLVGLAFIGTLQTFAAGGTSVLRGDSLYTRIFPDNFFLTSDKTEITGHRVAFQLGRDYPNYGGAVQPGCTSADYSICDGFAELNKLDGFDLQPRVTVPFSGPIDLGSVNVSDFYISDGSGAVVSGLRQLTFDPQTNILAGIADAFLGEDTTYYIHVTGAIKDAAGHPVDACKTGCVSRFTTRSGSAELVHIRQALDSGLAYQQAGIAGGQRALSFVQNGTADVFNSLEVEPSVQSPFDGIVRNDQVKADPNATGAYSSSAVPNLIPNGNAGYFAFGSFLSPRYQYRSATFQQDDPNGFTDGEIPPVPSKDTPPALGADRLGAIVITPDPAKFPPPWPAAVYGPGFTRSDYDIFVSADYNAAEGILTVATDPAGHGFGPGSTTTVTTPSGSTTFLSYGRGRDLDGDGSIGDGLNDGVGPTGHFQPGGGELPSRKPLDGLESGLVQTAVDNMALARAMVAGSANPGGLSIPGIGSNLVKPDQISYYGISFGGIYGTMLMGTDPLVGRGLMSVPGGPIVDIARLSGFRGDLGATLARSRPDFRNGGPGLDGFTEDLPLRTDPPAVITHPGAFALQELFGDTNWYDRTGSPETFAPRIRLRPDPLWAGNPKDVAFQTAYGDQTTTDPAADVIYRAGQLWDRLTFYRNDKTPTYASDPHGWLADPTLAGRESGQQELAAFLLTGQIVNTNPAWLEVPIADPNNLECLHYPEPETGQTPNPQPYPLSGDCPALSADG